MNIFIALTPYHLILTLTYVGRGEGDIVVLIDQTGRLTPYKDILPKLFARAIYIDATYRGVWDKLLALNKLSSRFHRCSIAAVGALIREAAVGQIYIFNDSAVEVQFLLSGLGELATYIEDGSAPYNEHWIDASILKRIAYPILLGGYYDCNSVLGTSRYVNRGLYLFPSLVRPENRATPCEQFHLSAEYGSRLNFFVSLFPGIGELQKTLADRPTTLLLLPSAITPGLKKELNNLLADEHARGHVVLVKRHPLQKNEFKFETGCEVVEAPSYVPAELLPVAVVNLMSVYGSESTSLLAYKYLFNALPVFSLADETGRTESRFSQVLKTIGVNQA
ncbi:hypothetical protein LJR296_003986 [Cupriavidus necator]|uniref:hypothetical protein n=1 Tax=Cupriavidus necator TaxID=106590 RepID=UPI003ECD611B